MNLFVFVTTEGLSCSCLSSFKVSFFILMSFRELPHFGGFVSQFAARKSSLYGDRVGQFTRTTHSESEPLVH